MKLYLLKRIEGEGYDKATGFVIRAESPHAARGIIFAGDGGIPWAGEEGSHVWLDPTLTTCRVLHADGKPGVVLRDFLYG